jgi:hypothetical protein
MSIGFKKPSLTVTKSPVARDFLPPSILASFAIKGSRATARITPQMTGIKNGFIT